MYLFELFMHVYYCLGTLESSEDAKILKGDHIVSAQETFSDLECRKLSIPTRSLSTEDIDDVLDGITPEINIEVDDNSVEVMTG